MCEIRKLFVSYREVGLDGLAFENWSSPLAIQDQVDHELARFGVSSISTSVGLGRVKRRHTLAYNLVCAWCSVPQSEHGM